MIDEFEFDDFELPEFDFLDEIFEFESRYIETPRQPHIKEEFLKYEYAENLAKDLKLFKDCRYFVLVNGTFYFGDFIEALIVINNLRVKKLTISTLSLNENNVDSLRNLLEGGFVENLNLIVSDFFFSHERKNLIPYIYKELDRDNKFQLAAARTHTKLAQFETFGFGRVVIHGSANLRTSDNLEQFVIEENESLYNFNDIWLSQILDTYKTINHTKTKSLRGKKLWNQITDQTDQKPQIAPEKAKNQKQKDERRNIALLIPNSDFN